MRDGAVNGITTSLFKLTCSSALGDAASRTASRMLLLASRDVLRVPLLVLVIVELAIMPILERWMLHLPSCPSSSALSAVQITSSDTRIGLPLAKTPLQSCGNSGLKFWQPRLDSDRDTVGKRRRRKIINFLMMVLGYACIFPVIHYGP
jgi:hypothetical protein